jgi:hypothetical protein
MSRAYHLLRVFQVCLLLVLAACSKENPKPKLAGTWNLRYTETDEYHTNGTLATASGLETPNPAEVYAFTDTDLTISSSTSMGSPSHYSYTHQGDLLTISFPDGNGQLRSQEFTVLELAKANLRLQARFDTWQGSYTLIRYHLVRK